MLQQGVGEYEDVDDVKAWTIKTTFKYEKK